MSDREEELKEFYKTFNPCFCPTLGEKVHFNSYGLQHLLYDRRKHAPRSKDERIYRLELLQYVQEVIHHSPEATELVKSDNPRIVTWSLIHILYAVPHSKIRLKVIVFRRGSGRIYFLSVMRVSKKPR
jgi:hypothetical protein